MATANFGEGAVFEISDNMIQKLKEFDTNLKNIERSAGNTAIKIGELSRAFNSLNIDSKVTAIEKMAAALDKMGGLNNVTQALNNMSTGIKSTGTSAQTSSQQVETMNMSLTKTSELMNRLSVSRPFQNMNITDLKGGISGINSMLEKQGKPIMVEGAEIGRNPVYTAAQQQALVNMRNAYQEELKIQQASESAKLTTIDRVAKAQNADALRQQKQDEQLLQSHLKSLDAKTKAEESHAATLRKIGEQQVQRTISNQKKTSLSSVNPDNLSTLAANRYMELGRQIDQLTTKQQNLNRVVKDYEFNLARIRAGKSGTVNSSSYESAKAELEIVNRQKAALEQKQTALVRSTAAYQQQIQMVRSLQTYEQERTGLPNLRSKQILADMRRYYTELEKSSAKAAAQAQREAERRAAAEERAAQRAQAAAEREAAAKQRLNERVAASLARIDARSTENYRKTYTGALQYSSNAKTLRDEAQAVEYLKQAKLSLSRTDENYQSKLRALNDALRQHEKHLSQAGIGAKNLQGQHRNLMDIAGQLQRRLALVFSVSQMSGFIQQIASVRGEFELQQRSLEAILQNKTQADQIFQKTVDLAIKSPFQIRQLVTYTKQLAAYRIEGDKLYDTTKRLADVSAGLGVDMQRLILAYGQVKAAAYLRGTEVRQFTEAGVNMYGELQRYFQEVKGRAYTTAQIVDMISKRMVKFEDVEAVFKRLTDQGGLFYNMQAIQSETLSGKISNLKDQYDIMLNEIGKDQDSILKGSIDVASTLLKHWESIVNVGKAVVAVFILMKAYSLQTGLTMGQMFTSMPMKGATTLGFLKALRLAFAKTSMAIKAFGANLKAAFITNAWVIGVMAAIGAIISFVSWMKESEAAIQDVLKNNGDLVRGLEQIKTAYDDAANAKDPFAEKRKQLQSLKDVVTNSNLKVKLDVDTVKNEDLDKEFAKLTKSYENFLRTKKAVDLAFAENNNRPEWWGLLGENIETDAKDLANAYENVIDHTKSVEDAVNLLYDGYSRLSDKQKEQIRVEKEAFDRSGIQKEGQDDIEFLKQRADAAEKFMAVLKRFKVETSSANNSLGDFKISWGLSDQGMHLKGQLNEFYHELDDIRDRIKARLGDKAFSKQGKIILSAVIDTKAADEGWNEWMTKVAKQHLGISVKLNKDNAIKESRTLADEVQDYFDRRKPTISVGLDISGLKSKLDEAAKRIKELQEDVEILGRAKPGAYNKLTVNKADYNRLMGTTNKEMGWYNDKATTALVSVSQYRAYLAAQRREQRKLFLYAGGDPDDIANKKKNRKSDAAKHERDIWAERISVLKEMQQQYEKVRQQYGEKTSRSMVLKEYMDDLKFVKMDAVMKPESIIPTKQGIVNALGKLFTAMGNDKKLYRKRADLQKTISQLKLEISTEEAEKRLGETKKKIESLFNGLDLHDKLKDVGLNESEIQQMFPNLAKTLDDVEKGIHDRFQKLKEEGKFGDKEQEEYTNSIKNLNEKRVKEQQDLVVELTKAYKTQLSDQLQLDIWYYKERDKIAGSKLPDLMKKEYRANLNTQYNKKTTENAWNAFKGSDTYLHLFSGDMENMSTKTLDMMKKKLENLKESLKNLDPSQLKEVTDLYKKMEDITSERSPIKSLVDSLKEVRKLKAQGKTEDSLVADIQANDEQNAALQNEIGILNHIVQLKEEGKKLTEEDVEYLNKYPSYSKQPVQSLKNQIDSKQKIIQKNKEQNAQNVKNLSIIEKARKAFGKAGEAWVELLNNAKGASSAVAALLKAMGKDADDTAATIMDITLNIADAIVQALLFAMALDTVSKAMKSALGPIGYIMIAIEAIATIVTSILGVSDKKKEKEIERLQQKIEKLQRAYDDLKKAMDDAWNISELQTYNQQMKKNLEMQNQYLRSQIRAEQSRKNSDQSKITEWTNQIEDNLKTIKENAESAIEAAGGLGSKANWKSAAQDFADAWVDAFNEGEDSLAALNKSFDELINNMIKKQVMLRVVSKYLEPILKMIDDAVDEKGPGGMKVLKEELDAINKKWQETSPEMNEALKNLMETIGHLPTNLTELDSLKESIQGMTETTAEALEALLNSIRFFLSTQQTDVAVIKQILQTHFAQSSSNSSTPSQSDTGQDNGVSNPILQELKSQTQYLKMLASGFENAFMTSTKGKGLRVYVM